MIGFASTNAVPQAAAFGGTRKVLGTNPLCFAVPGGQRGPIILDMATSVVANSLAALNDVNVWLGRANNSGNSPAYAISSTEVTPSFLRCSITGAVARPA